VGDDDEEKPDERAARRRVSSVQLKSQWSVFYVCECMREF
jgi:hypothetical protein